MTGWRLGWMVSPADITAAAANLQSHLSSNVSNISQRAAIAALTGVQSVVEDMKKSFARRRALMVGELSKIDGFVVPEPGGAFYVYADVTGLLGREWGGNRIDTTVQLADYILDAAEVAVVPGEAFGPSGYLRFSYALGDDELLEGLHRLQKLFA
jgi:aspartate aminotransferase